MCSCCEHHNSHAVNIAEHYIAVFLGHLMWNLIHVKQEIPNIDETVGDLPIVRRRKDIQKRAVWCFWILSDPNPEDSQDDRFPKP